MKYYRIKRVKNAENIRMNNLIYKLKSISVPTSFPPDDRILKRKWCPYWVAQLVRASYQYVKVTGSISNQGTYNMQPMNA